METDVWGNGTFHPHRTYKSIREAKGVPFDYIVCANKASCDDVSSFVDDFAHAVTPNTTLVAIQNGIGIEEKLRQMFPRNPILSAICYVACIQEPLGTVKQTAQIRPHAFHVGRYKQGSMDPAVDQAKLEEFVSLDDKFKLVPDIQTERWAKLIFNGAWSPTSALSDMDTQQILKGSVSNVMLVHKLAREVFEVAVKGGHQLPEDIEHTTFDAVARSAPIIPSMLQDARKGRPMEIEALCGMCDYAHVLGPGLTNAEGDIWKYADALGVPVPTLKAVYSMLAELNRTFIMRPKISVPGDMTLSRTIRPSATT
jgi:2-dehydropantoate 2-reductase